jgi:hypothetical protein
MKKLPPPLGGRTYRVKKVPYDKDTHIRISAPSRFSIGRSITTASYDSTHASVSITSEGPHRQGGVGHAWPCFPFPCLSLTDWQVSSKITRCRLPYRPGEDLTRLPCASLPPRFAFLSPASMSSTDGHSLSWGVLCQSPRTPLWYRYLLYRFRRE